MNIACMAIQDKSNKYMLKTYTKSGIKTIQLKTFSETSYYDKINQSLVENPGMTADKLATHFKINVGVMKEHIQEAEMKGFICIDESHEGLRYFSNLFKTFDITAIWLKLNWVKFNFEFVINYLNI